MRVKIHPTAIVYPNVKLEDNVVVEAYSIIGYCPQNVKKKLKTVIGADSLIRSHSIIYAGVKTGNHFVTGHGVLIREFTDIGDNTRIGTFSQIDGYCKIGFNVRIHTNVYVGQHSIIEDHVFIAPLVILANISHPRCPKVKECIKGPIIRRFAKIGARSIIMPRVTIGENSLIGAGAVVTKDILRDSVAVGSPARVVKNIYKLTCPYNLIDKPYSNEYGNVAD